MPALNAFIVEDIAVIRDSLIATLEELAPVQVVGHAADAAGALGWLGDPAHHCDLVVIDLFLHRSSGIEVLRGPMSALYGNSSGGVVQVFTEPGQGQPRVEASVLAGSDELRRVGLKASGANGPLSYLLSTSLLGSSGPWRSFLTIGSAPISQTRLVG